MIEDVLEFNKKYSREMDINSRMLDIQSELGELSKEVLKATKYGEKDFVATESFKEELGDVLYSLISLGLECKVDIKRAVLDVLKKYQRRIENKGNMSSNN